MGENITSTNVVATQSLGTNTSAQPNLKEKNNQADFFSFFACPSPSRGKQPPYTAYRFRAPARRACSRYHHRRAPPPSRFHPVPVAVRSPHSHRSNPGRLFIARGCDACCRKRHRCYCASSPASAAAGLRGRGLGSGGCELQEGRGWAARGGWWGERPPAIAGGRGGGGRQRTLWSGDSGVWGGAGHRRP